MMIPNSNPEKENIFFAYQSEYFLSPLIANNLETIYNITYSDDLY